MKKVKARATKEQAEALGLKPNASGRYRVTQEQYDQLNVLKSKSGNNFQKAQLKGYKQKVKVSSKSDSNDYTKSGIMSALDGSGKMMNIDTYCEFYNLPRKDISSYKLVSHTGCPFYNIVFREIEDENSFDIEEIKNLLKKEIKREYIPKFNKAKKKKEAVLKWSDLHFGAYTRNLLNTDDFDKDILLDGLLESIEECNDRGFEKTHIHINGDLIESFSGLNHINSWQSMDSEIIGANAVRLCSKMLHTALKEVNNLGCVKIVAGNHDRLSKNNDEDVKGGAADLIAYCLELMGYDVEFHPYVITHYVDGINHINLHGDKSISKKSTEKIILDYGKQGIYNLINEGHLHSVIEKLSIKQRESFEILKDDSILHRRFYLPSFFTGNYYSATLGYTTNPGYFIIWSNKKNRPQFFNGSV